VAISDDGSIAAAIWSVTLADGSRVQAARHSAAGWGAPENLSIPGTQYGWPRVALSADGDRAVAIWGPSNLAITTDAQAATWSFGAWSSPTPIATGSGLFPQIGVTGDGSAALAVWNATGGTVQSRGWGQGSWQEATTLSDPAVSSAASRVALGSVADQAVILWRTTTGTVQAVSPAGPPDPPTDINAVPGDASITLTWSAPRRDGGRPITGYTATALPGGATCTATELTCTIGGLTNGEGYQVSVRATNLVGTSLASAASHQVVPAPPPTPAQSPAAVEPTAVPGATATPVTTTVISGWVRRMRTKAGKARVRFTVTPAQGRIVQLQRRYRRWRTIRTFNLAVAPSARVSVRLRPGKYRVVVPESPGASSAATPVLRVTDRRR
jgi:hypothetical protein